MKTYLYTVKDDMGRTLHGFMAATNTRELKRTLSHSKLYLTATHGFDADKLFNKKIGLEALLLFTRRLTSLVEAGIPILSAMRILWRQTENRTMQLVISHMQNSLEEGNTISESMEEFPRIFPMLYRAMVRVAEKTGSLVVVLRRLSAHLEYQKQFVTRIKKAVMYPAVVVVFAVMVLIGMFAFVVPVFETVLMSLNAELPALTKVIIGISKALKSWQVITAFFLLLVLLFLLYRRFRHVAVLRSLMDHLKLKIPYIGYIIYTVAISRFVHSLGMLLAAGLPIVDSFNISRTMAGNQKIANGIAVVQSQVEQGASLYKSFQEANVFPVLLVEMVGVGETSGAIVKVFENLAAHFDEEVDYNLTKLVTFMEPLLIIFVGGIVIVTLLAIYMPVFSIWESLAR